MSEPESPDELCMTNRGFAESVNVGDCVHNGLLETENGKEKGCESTPSQKT